MLPDLNLFCVSIFIWFYWINFHDLFFSSAPNTDASKKRLARWNTKYATMTLARTVFLSVFHISVKIEQNKIKGKNAGTGFGLNDIIVTFFFVKNILKFFVLKEIKKFTNNHINIYLRKLKKNRAFNFFWQKNFFSVFDFPLCVSFEIREFGFFVVVFHYYVCFLFCSLALDSLSVFSTKIVQTEKRKKKIIRKKSQRQIRPNNDYSTCSFSEKS
jgi:hypothetical protein